MTTELLASIAADSESELVRLSLEASGGADGIELRVDSIARPDLSRLREEVGKLGKPILLTCRSRREGGAFEGDEDERLALLRRAIDVGFDFVDLEIESLSAPVDRDSSGRVRIVLSHHDFERLPPNAEELVDRALDLGADIVKIAAKVSSLGDSLRLAELGERVRAAGKDFAPVFMGPSGTSARILAPVLGARFAFAPVAGARATGPGQVRLDELVELYRFSAIGQGTEIYGVLGSRATTSLSPVMHNRLLARLGRNAVYVPFQENEIEPFVAAARRLAISGLSVTLPFKESIVPYLDEVDAEARRIGAVNTVVVREGRWKGFNTDRDGVLEPLRSLGALESIGTRRTVVLGAGGAARAAVAALSDSGARVVVLARDESRAEALARSWGAGWGTIERLSASPWDVLVNATPVGSEAAPGDLPTGEIPESAVVFDMVTIPERTPLIERARAAGALTVTGLQMLAAQAAHQARLWGFDAPSAMELLRYARAGAEGSEASRYSRQVLFKEIGAEGQGRIRRAAVLVVGAGALGSIASEMLVRAGVGRLVLVDRDYVDESNLQRQTLYDEGDVRDGLPKAVAAARKLGRINGGVDVEGRVEDVHRANVLALLDGMDLVVDGTDNFETRYLLNDASIRTGIPWIYAAAVGSYGMSFVVVPGKTPCLRCLLEDEPPPGTSPTCDTAGVIAPAVHAVAAFQVAEALKILSGRTGALTGALVSLDVWQGRFDRFRPSQRREDCPACGVGRLDFLEGDSESQTVSLCGRNAVQVRPARPASLSLQEIGARLSSLGETKVTVNRYLLRARFGEREIVLFPDGRAIVHGTDDPAVARALYARYVGN
jgi:molybdopterin-synthase adenylyltransferase